MAPALAAVEQPQSRRSRLRYAAIALLILIAAFALVFALLVVNNNYSLRHRSRADFIAQMDEAIEKSTQWIVAHPEVQGNPSIMYMLGDMAQMSRDPRLQDFVQSYRGSKWVRVPGNPLSWYYARLVDPKAPVPILRGEEMQTSELLWDSYAAAPQSLLLTKAQYDDLFSTNTYVWGHRNHQLLALAMYRHFNGTNPEQDAVINTVAKGVARDGYWDFRVSDSYEQRSAFLLAAGRPDLVRSRWIERFLANQQPDGAWNYCWYGWCRGVFEFRFGESAKGDQGHSTVQAAWALYQLKYRNGDWINAHYH